MSEASAERPRLSALGEGAVLVDMAGPVFDEPVQARILALAQVLNGEPGVCETVPGMNNLLVLLDRRHVDPDAFELRLLALWRGAQADRRDGRTVEIPVRYGGPDAEADLLFLAAHTGLAAAEVVRRHAAPLYRVAAIGAMPGFPYLSGLDPALRCPRRPVPRAGVPKGAVILGGAQAGIMPLTAPSGWHILGLTDLALFDPVLDPPALLRPGDRVRFRAVEAGGA